MAERLLSRLSGGMGMLVLVGRKKKKCYFLERLVLELKLLVSSYTCMYEYNYYL